MNYYVDIRILSSPDFSNSILMNELFSMLHKSLVKVGNGEVGISFPEFGKTLGGLLRLHGHQSALQQLMKTLRILGLKDYVTISDITPIPENVSYRVVQRIQAKSSTERLFRRSVRKGWLTQEEATQKSGYKNKKKLSLPYLKVKSSSTGQPFLLFVKHGPTLPTPLKGEFSAYGLSVNATVPWF